MFEVEKPTYISKTFRMKAQLLDRLSAYAAESGVSVNALVSQCCEYALDHIKPLAGGDTHAPERHL